LSTTVNLATLILILLFWSKNFILFTTYRLQVDSGLVDPEVNRMKKAKFSTAGVTGLLDKYNIVIE
jgi:fluoroquinolone resistance protein